MLDNSMSKRSNYCDLMGGMLKLLYSTVKAELYCTKQNRRWRGRPRYRFPDMNIETVRYLFRCSLRSARHWQLPLYAAAYPARNRRYFTLSGRDLCY